MSDTPPARPAPMAGDVEQIITPLVQHFQATELGPKAVLWPNAEDLPHRFDAMLSGIDWDAYSPDKRLRLLDVGCGPGYLLDYLAAHDLLDRVDYVGTDLAEPILAVARRRWPGYRFEYADIRDAPFAAGAFDHAVMCGIFTAKFALGHDAMLALCEQTLAATWPMVTRSLAFNAMSSHVDWERDDLFHLPVDTAIALCRTTLGTRIVRVLHDYGLYDYTLVAARAPVRQPDLAADWCADQPAAGGGNG